MTDKRQPGPPKRFVSCPEEQAFIQLQRTADALTRRTQELLKKADIPPAQYNVLRILRGSPEGLPCREIGDRMISRDPDITRLLDRLEKRGLIARCRESQDRRVVLTRITPEGLRVLAELDGPMTEIHRRQLAHLGRERLKLLSELLAEAARNTG